jgi:drug/metabolite transporter (DMT)-like permease
MAATVIIWATNNVIVKAVLDRLDPLAFVAARFTLVTLMLLTWLRFRRSPLGVDRQDWPLFLFCGLSGFAVSNVLFTLALDHGSAFSAAVLVALGPVFALLIAAAIRIERVLRVQWLGIGCALLGVGLFAGERLAGKSPVAGDLLAVGSAATFAAYSLATRRIVRRYGSPLVTCWLAAIGGIATLPVTVPRVRDQDWGALGAGGWTAILYSSALSMLLAYTIWGWAIERRGVGRTVPYLYLVPILSGALAMLFLDERISLVQGLGAATILTGVALARRAAPIPAISSSRRDP